MLPALSCLFTTDDVPDSQASLAGRGTTIAVRTPMVHSPARLLRVLIIEHDGGQWLAQGVDYNLATQAPSPEAAKQGFMRILRAHLRRDVELGREPLAGIGSAPEQFFEIWKQIEQTSPLAPPTPVDEQIKVPFYMLTAMANSGTELKH